jgi:hypothetical protein
VFTSALTTKPSILALMAGALLLIVCSLLRVAGQPLVGQVPMVSVTLSLLAFLVPGLIAGAIAPRSFFWDGAILGMIAAAFVTLQSFQFQHPDWSSILIYRTIGMWAFISVPCCIVGALCGRIVSGRR